MKIVAISDLHGHIPQVPACDVLCICGDILPLDIQRRSIDSAAWLASVFYPWANSRDCKHVVYIPGNHDFMLEQYLKNHPCEEAAWTFDSDNSANSKVHLLYNQMIELDGVKFYGTPVCPDLKNWAFYRDSLMLKDEFDKIPFGIDVLLTHCPPKTHDMGKVLQKKTFNEGADYGCEILHQRLMRKPVKQLVLCGHVHSGNHKIQYVDEYGCRVVNCSLKDEDYKVKYEPIEIEI